MMTKVSADLANQEKLTPFIGMWSSTIVFLPFGMFLTYKAMNDSQLMNIEGFQNWIQEKLAKKNAN